MIHVTVIKHPSLTRQVVEQKLTRLEPIEIDTARHVHRLAMQLPDRKVIVVDSDVDVPLGDSPCMFCSSYHCTWASMYINYTFLREKSTQVHARKIIDMPRHVIDSTRRGLYITPVRKGKKYSAVVSLFDVSMLLEFCPLVCSRSFISCACTRHVLDVDGRRIVTYLVYTIEETRDIVTLCRLVTHPVLEIVDTDGDLFVLSPSVHVPERIRELQSVLLGCRVRILTDKLCVRLCLNVQEVWRSVVVKPVVVHDVSERTCRRCLLLSCPSDYCEVLCSSSRVVIVV